MGPSTSTYTKKTFPKREKGPIRGKRVASLMPMGGGVSGLDFEELIATEFWINFVWYKEFY